MDAAVLDDLIASLPTRLAVHAIMASQHDEWFDDTLIMHRFIRCLLADRLLPLLPESMRSKCTEARASQYPHDQAAKRTVLHAMAMLAVRGHGILMAPRAEAWSYPREHLYRAAEDIAEAMELLHWRELAAALSAEDIWPYSGGYVIEILGSPGTLPEAWPISPYFGRPSQATTWFPGTVHARVPVIQVAIDNEPTREDCLPLQRSQGILLQCGIEITPLEIIQRCWELRQMQTEAETERGYASQIA